MMAAQASAKIYTRLCEPETSAFIAVFHRWIQQQKLAELMIDVADYTHVHHGPGVLLVAHEAYYGIDEGEGRRGMLYRRRRGEAQPAAEALRLATRAALTACQLIEEELGNVRFDTSEVLVGFDDRLHAPNDEATHEKLRRPLEELGAALFGEATISCVGEPREPFRARLRGQAEASVATLLSRLA